MDAIASGGRCKALRDLTVADDHIAQVRAIQHIPLSLFASRYDVWRIGYHQQAA